MPKRKLQRFAEMKTFPNVIQPDFSEVFGKDHPLKGRWNEALFNTAHSIVLELGCGKGEYTTGLARQHNDKHFIGCDIKGARIWRGARTALEENLTNVAFIRSRIELINSFFAAGEVDEIWITFPDPQPKKKNKRLSSPRFLRLYQQILKDNGIIHLKTDNASLARYSRNVAKASGLHILTYTEDLYGNETHNEMLQIKTFYEQQFLSKGMKIHYLKFELPNEKTLCEPGED